MEQIYYIIYTKMQLSPIRNKYITFRTIEWFPELDIPRNYVFINDTRCKEIVSMYDPTRDRFLDIYRDNMITGLIKIL